MALAQPQSERMTLFLLLPVPTADAKLSPAGGS
jgi:hypothetical protein